MFLIVRAVATSQNLVPAVVESNLIFVSEDKAGHAVKYSVGNAYMLLSLSNGDFTLNADLSAISTGNKRQDSLVSSYGSQMLSFKGNIGENLMVFNRQENDEKSYPMSGVLTVNTNSVSGVAQFDPINLAEKGETKNYRMDFLLSIDPSKIVIKGMENMFAKQIVLEIVAGKLNVQQ
ncbi:hypothetical protein CNR22_20190 [Sphingobacteriaceae bacterium]|nr:hypothetical protein CNR22_20190 [Sphingobacteriaceae bacterium]